jgi:DNA-binding XRE family transcriptional regulator
MHHENKLSALRRSWALTQAELGSLLDVSEDAIGNYENAENAPSLLTLIGLEIAFGRTLHAFFPEASFAVAQRMLKALADFSIRLEGLTDDASERKRTLISAAADHIDRIFPGI